MATKDLKMRVSVDGAEQAMTKLSSLNGVMTKMISTIGVAAVGMAVLKKATDLVVKSADEARKGFVAWRQVQTTLNSTGRIAEITTAQVADLAVEIQKLSNFGDEDIMQNAITSLMRFDEISTELLPRATKMVADMAASSGDLAGQAKQLGIALADPILGITRLRKAQVMFSDEQEAAIKNFMEQGKLLQAQGVLLDALDTKYKGLAVASVDAGTMLKNSWSDYLQYLGQSTAPVIDGIKQGLAMFFLEISEISANTSEEMMRGNLRVQKDMAIRSAAIGISTKAVIQALSAFVVTNVQLVKSAIDLVSSGVTGVLQFVGNEVLRASARLVRINPLNAFLTANKVLLEQFFKIDTRGVFDWMNNYANQLESRISDLANPMQTFSDSWNRVARNLTNVGQSITQVFDSARSGALGTTESITNLFNELEKTLTQQLTGIDLGDLNVAGIGGTDTTAMDSRKAELLAMIDELRKTGLTEEQILDQQRQAKIAYYGKLIQDARTIYPQITAEEEAVLKKFARWQIEQETKHLAELAAITRQRFEEHLTFVQNRTNAEVDMLKELGTDYAAYEQARMIQIAFEIEQLAKLGIAEEYLIALQAKRINGIPAEFKAISESTTKTITEIDTASKMVNDVTDNMVNGFSSAFANMITEGQSFSDSMVSVFRNMVNQLLAELAKLALFELFKSVFSVSTGGVGGVIGNALGGSGVIKTANSPHYTPDISTITTDGQFNRILSRLEQTINSRQPQDVVLRIGNREFRNAIQYSTIEANVM